MELLLKEYMIKMITTLERKKVVKSEEFILNVVSCATNLLFYDIPTKEDSIFDYKLRIRIFNAVKMFVLEISNEEL